MSAGIFDGLSSLELLGLHGNRLTALPAGAFDGLASRRVLYLGGNGLSALPDGAFDGLSSLRELWLGGNCLALPAASTAAASKRAGLTLKTTGDALKNRRKRGASGAAGGLPCCRAARTAEWRFLP